MRKYYKVSGNDKVGHRIAIPSEVQRYKRYQCFVQENGIIVYTPIVPGKAEEKGV